jgi:predicted HTH transcriptional regulator
MQRMFQQSGLLYADEQIISAANLDNLDQPEFAKYFERRYGKPVAAIGMPLERLLQNLNLSRNGIPNLTGMLLFGKWPHHLLPAFIVKAVAFPGTVLHDSHYQDSQDIEGTLAEQYERSLDFIKRNLHHIQGNRSFNSPGQLEIPTEAFEELLVNALVHRDYFISAPIRLLIYTDRVEIISPGHLPNHLDTEQIRFGLSNLRNPALASHAFNILPYRGLGSGIKRAVEAWPRIEFLDERDANQFRVILKRPEAQTEGVNGGVNRGVNGGVNDLLDVIRKNPGLRAPALAKRMGLTPKNIEHRIRQLREDQKIEFIGSPKTGGYHSL